LDEIKPTVLYIKQHMITNKKYLGKTTKDPYKYKGSGKYWLRHINKFGKNYIVTLWVSEPFTNQTELTEYALKLSKELDIINSKDWCNLILENGKDGGIPGTITTEEVREKISKALIGIKRSEETKRKMSKPKTKEHVQHVREKLQGKKFTEEHKINLSKGQKGKIPWNKGKNTPKEVCDKISKSCTGRKTWNKGLRKTGDNRNG